MLCWSIPKKDGLGSFWTFWLTPQKTPPGSLVELFLRLLFQIHEDIWTSNSEQISCFSLNIEQTWQAFANVSNLIHETEIDREINLLIIFIFIFF